MSNGLILTNKNKQKTRQTTILIIIIQRKQMETVGVVWKEFLCVYIYIYIYIYLCVCVCVCLCVFVQTIAILKNGQG